jgi:hypothetical protein
LVPQSLDFVEAATGFEPVNNGFADRCLSHLAMPPKRMESWNVGILEEWESKSTADTGVRVLSFRQYPHHSSLPLFHYSGFSFGAGNGTRTRDNHVGNVGLYQLSYSRSKRFHSIV